MPTFKLKVSPVALNLGQTVLSAVFSIKRASVVDSFVIVPDLKHGVVVVDNEDFEVNLLPNTPGSVYEVVLFGARTELMRAFFIMPENDVFLHELNLLTAYPEMNPVFATFLQLNDTPNSYVGHAGKLVAVKQDETGLEFIELHDTPPTQSGCEGATDSATIGSCSAGGILEYFVNDVSLGSILGRDAYAGYFEGQGLRVIPIMSNGSVDMGYPNYNNTEYQCFENLTADTIRVRVATVDASNLTKQLGDINPTVIFTNTPGVSIAEFCLLPTI